MATSSYKTYLDTIIDNYIGRLIKNVVQIDETSENYQIAAKYVKSNLLYHRYLDTNKNEIERNVQGIVEKLTVHSQGEKAERLDFLMKKFLTKPLKQDVPDIHYAVLSMLLNLSSNPLESVYYQTKFQVKTDENEVFTKELQKELDMQNQIEQEWGYSDAESVEEDEEEIEEEIDEQKENVFGNINKQKTKVQQQQQQKDSKKEQIQKADQKQPFSLLDKQLLLGTLPMQSYSSFSGLGVFSLPTPGPGVNNAQQIRAEPENIGTRPVTAPVPIQQSIFPTPQKIQQTQKSAKKRMYSQLLEDEKENVQEELSGAVDKFEEDKNFIERNFLQKNIWKNPNSLNEILRDYYLKPDDKGRPRGEFSELNHWLYTLKTERALVQDILLMLKGIESDTFKLNDLNQFERRVPIQLKHISPEALKGAIENLVYLGSATKEIESNLRVLSESFNTTVIEGYSECVRDFAVKYEDFIEDIQCIFLKQASQVRPSDLGTRHPDLQSYLEKNTITIMELLKVLDPFMKNFVMIGDITRHLIRTFNNAVSNLEEVTRGETTAAKVMEIKPFISMVTLSYLYRLLTETIFGAREDSTNVLLIKLFFKSWEPYLELLDKWLKHGTLMDKHSEFFIKYNKNINTLTNFYSKINWAQDYVFQNYTVKWKLLNEEKTFMCIPSFLSKYADTIATIGKTIKVLGYLIHQENLYLYLNKLDFKEEFFMNILKRMEEDEPENGHNMQIEVLPLAEREVKVVAKDYTFGAKLRSQQNSSRVNNLKKENLLYNSLQTKLDPYKNNSEFSNKFGISAFSISQSLTNKTSNENDKNFAQKNLKQVLNQSEDKNVKKANVKFYDKIMSKKGQESLNNLKIYLDYEVENLLVNMESHYSCQLTDLLFNHFHLMEYLRLFRIIFFFEQESVYENFLPEVLLKVRSSLLESNMVRLNQLLKESLGKIKGSSVKNISTYFTIEPESKTDYTLSTAILSNFAIAFKGTYPLDLVFDSQVLKLYNRIFKFVIQIKRAKFALTANSVSIKRPLKPADIKRARIDESVASYEDAMQEEEPSPWSKKSVPDDIANRVKQVNDLKRKFGLVQGELLHFVNNLEFFVGFSVIKENTKEYNAMIQESANIIEINAKLKEYLEKIAEICQLHRTKNDMLSELIKSTLNLCWDFYVLYNRLEERFTFMTGNQDIVIKIWDELETLENSFQENNRMILQILNQYHQKGHKLQLKSLFSNLNFNYYYISETGEYVR